MLRARIFLLRVGGRVRGSAIVSRNTYAYGDGFGFGTGFVLSTLVSISCTMVADAAEVIGEVGKTGKGQELLSTSVSVSVSSPGGFDREAVRL